MNREYPAHPLVGVGVVVRKEDNVLLVKRANVPGRGLWSVPGGLVKLGEMVQDAALREVKEETGLKVEIDGIFNVVDHVSRDSRGKVRYHYVIVDFRGHPVGGMLRASSDSLDVRWIKLKDLKNYRLTRTLRKTFKRNGLI